MFEAAPYPTADAGPGSGPTDDSQSRVAIDRARPIALTAIDSSGPHDSVGLRALFESILRWGILQPLIVRPSAPGRFEVIAGHKRFAAARSAGFTEVPCAVFEGSDADAAALAAASNTVPAAGPAPVPAVSAAPEGAAAVLRQLHAVHETIARALAIDGEPDGLRQRIARELLAVELQRASWITDALLAFHDAPPGGSRGPVAVGPLLRAVIEPFRPECRLGGIDVRVTVDPGDLTVASRERSLRMALNCVIGAVVTTMHAGGPHADPTLVIHAGGASAGTVLSVRQNVAALQALARLRSGGRGAGAPAGEGLLAAFAFEAARRTIDGLGGRVEIRVEGGDVGGAIEVRLPPMTA